MLAPGLGIRFLMASPFFGVRACLMRKSLAGADTGNSLAVTLDHAVVCFFRMEKKMRSTRGDLLGEWISERNLPASPIHI